MNKKLKTFIRRTLCGAVMAAMIVSLIPLNTEAAYAASFSTSGKVKNVKVSDRGTSYIKLTWSSYPGASGYRVYRATSKNGSYKTLGYTKGRTFKNTTVSPGSRYYYKIRAYKKYSGIKRYAKYSSVISASTKSKLPAFSTSGKVSGFQIISTDTNGIRLQWNSYKGATRYQIYRASSSGGSYHRLVTTNKTSYRDTEVSAGKVYYYKIRAYQKNGNSKRYTGFGSVISSETGFGTPSVSVEPMSSKVALTWNSVKGATGYEISRSTSYNGTYKVIKEVTKTSFNNTSVTRGEFYYYKVRAFIKSGDKYRYGNYSSVVKGTTMVGVPSNFLATPDKGAVVLTWDPVSNATGYAVYRASSETGSYSELGKTTTSAFKNTSVVEGKTYYYKIKSYVDLNGKRFYSSLSDGTVSRQTVVNVAKGWLGAKEYSSMHKEIINIYNSNLAPGCGKMTYSLPWCAAYVSAVGIKAKATDIIVRGSYCPTMINTYKKNGNYSGSKSYIPAPGDVVFFDWNRNGVPDHVGLVYSVSGKSITTIEGNKSDAVGTRNYTAGGYSLVQGYGLPKYGGGTMAKYTGKASGTSSPLAYGVGCGEPVGEEEIVDSDYEAVKAALEKGCGEDATELEKMQVIINKVREQAEPEELACSVSEYYAAFVYRLSTNAGIEASIVSSEDGDGGVASWVEAVLDGKLYIIDASQKGCKPKPYEPDVTDVNLDEAGEVIEGEQ